MELKNTTQPSIQEENKKSLTEITDKLPDELVSKEDYAKLCLLYLKANNTQLTEQELAQFILICYQKKLNPWDGEAYAIKYGNKPFQVLTGYKVYVKRAAATGLLDWWEVEVIDEPQQKTQTDKIINLNPKPYKAIFRGKRRDSSKEVSFSYRFNEWDQHQALWLTKPEFMLKKVAMSNSFRLWFPVELGELPYTIEENWNDLEEANKQIERQNKIIDAYEELQKEKDKEKVKNAF